MLGMMHLKMLALVSDAVTNVFKQRNRRDRDRHLVTPIPSRLNLRALATLEGDRESVRKHAQVRAQAGVQEVNGFHKKNTATNAAITKYGAATSTRPVKRKRTLSINGSLARI